MCAAPKLTAEILLKFNVGKALAIIEPSAIAAD